MRRALAVLLLCGCAGQAAAPPVGAPGPQPSAADQCNHGDEQACRELEAAADRTADTAQAAQRYLIACGRYPECAGNAASHLPCDPPHREGYAVLGSACRKLAEIYWDNRASDARYQQRANLAWRRSCEAMHPDSAACQPRELYDPAPGRPLMVPPAPPAPTMLEAYDAGRAALNAGDYAHAVAAFQRALELVPDHEPVQRAKLACSLAESYRMAEDYLSALEPYQQCLAGVPAKARAHFQTVLHELEDKLGFPGRRRPRPAARRPLP